MSNFIFTVWIELWIPKRYAYILTHRTFEYDIIWNGILIGHVSFLGDNFFFYVCLLKMCFSILNVHSV